MKKVKMLTFLLCNQIVKPINQSVSLFYLFIGRPRPPRFTSEVIGYKPDSYNITWITDTYKPITEYKILYRRSDVSCNNFPSSKLHKLLTSEVYEP